MRSHRDRTLRRVPGRRLVKSPARHQGLRVTQPDDGQRFRQCITLRASGVFAGSDAAADVQSADPTTALIRRLPTDEGYSVAVSGGGGASEILGGYIGT